MNKINYDKKMQEEISTIIGKKKLLLQSCCGPCSSAVIDRLKENFDITVYYYNPNIYPESEFVKRAENQQKVVNFFDGCKVIFPKYNEEEFLTKVNGLESEKEGGARCSVCFALRLDKTAQYAKENGFDYFSTTLTVSPHKNEQLINSIGEKIAEKYSIPFLNSDFKKHEGYKRSIILSKQLDLYRQDYCGCRFSKKMDNDEI